MQTLTISGPLEGGGWHRRVEPPIVHVWACQCGLPGCPNKRHHGKVMRSIGTYHYCRCDRCRAIRKDVRRAVALARTQRASRIASGRLLRERLSPSQRKQWDAHKSFRVVTPRGRVFDILNKGSSNIEFVSGPSTSQWEPPERLCVAFREDRLPLPDLLLAIKLTLESPGGESRLLRIAA